MVILKHHRHRFRACPWRLAADSCTPYNNITRLYLPRMNLSHLECYVDCAARQTSKGRGVGRGLTECTPSSPAPGRFPRAPGQSTFSVDKKWTGKRGLVTSVSARLCDSTSSDRRRIKASSSPAQDVPRQPHEAVQAVSGRIPYFHRHHHHHRRRRRCRTATAAVAAAAEAGVLMCVVPTCVLLSLSLRRDSGSL